MNKAKSLLLFSLITSCLWIFALNATTQNDNRLRPLGAVPDPCAFPNPPSYCIPTPTPTPIQRDERKGIVLGPASVLRPYTVPEDQDLRGPSNGKSNIEILNESGTGYVRLWVDWSVLQPYPSFGNFIRVDPNTKPLIEALDAQIKEAKKNSLKVILTVHHSYPTWTVWYRGKPPSGSCNEDRNRNHKICQRVPSNLGESSPWSGFIGFLVSEYGFTKDKVNPEKSSQPEYNRYVDVLEIVNEPNLTLRTPQRQQQGRLVIALNVAEMFETAQKIVRRQNNTLRMIGNLDPGATTIKLAGPATSDTVRNDGNFKSYQDFTTDLLRALKDRGFVAGSGFVWTHHNYLDTEEQRHCTEEDSHCSNTYCTDYYNERVKKDALSEINSAAWVEKSLRRGVGGYKWQGMQDKNGNPAIFLTEGGVRLHQVIKIYWCQLGLPHPLNPSNPAYMSFIQAVDAKRAEIKDKQADLVGKSFALMSQGPLSRGILLFTNYLTYTDPAYDTGMFDYIGPCGSRENPNEGDWYDRAPNSICTGENGAERPLYEKWKSLQTP